MENSKILESFIPEMRCEETDMPESETRLPEGAILVNPYGLIDMDRFFYYEDYQSYLDDEPYIRQCIEKFVKIENGIGEHIFCDYDCQNPVHRRVKKHSFLILMHQSDNGGILLDGVVSTFKEAMTGKRLKHRLILPLKELELSKNLFYRSSKRAILKDIYNILKRRGINVKH